MKIGLLCPGCVYDGVGSVSHAREFIRSFKESIRGSTDTVLGLWQRFERFVEQYPFPSANSAFKLIISTRASSTARFAELDSASGLDQAPVPHSYFLAAYGTGASALNERISREFTPRLKMLQQFLLKQNQPLHLIHRLSPYFLCLWLNEMSLTFEVSQMASLGVGGVFHFVCQDSTIEQPQDPAIYIFSSADKTTRTIYSWVYRVAAVQGGLYVNSQSADTTHNGNVAYFDSAARYDVEVYTQDELRELVQQELASLRFYYFCDPLDRRSFGFSASSNGKREDIFDNSGRFTDFFKARIAENFD